MKTTLKYFTLVLPANRAFSLKHKTRRKQVSRLLIIVFTVLIFSPNALLAQTSCNVNQSGKIGNMSSEKWIEDIDFMINRLEIMHPDIYASVNKEKFNGFADELRNRSRLSSDVDMMLGITELIAMVRDGHTYLDLKYSGKRISDLFHMYPIRLFLFSDGLFVLSAEKKWASTVGSKVIKIGDLAWEDVINLLAKLRVKDNDWGAYNHILLEQEWLVYQGILKPGENLKITLENNQKRISVIEIEYEPLMACEATLMKKIYPQPDSLISTINENSENPMPLWLSKLDSSGFSGDKYWYTYLPEQKAMYVQVNQCENKRNDPFNQFCGRMFNELDEKKAKRLIIDIRNNNGGNHLERPLLLGILERPEINQSDRLFLITSRFTASAAQHMLNELCQYTQVTVFGEPTNNRPHFFGAPRRFKLPNSGLVLNTSIIEWQNGDPGDFSILTEPDFYVPLSSTDFSNNYDPVLDRIFNYDSYKGMRSDFTDKLSEAYKKEGLQGLKSTYEQIKPSYSKYGFNMETLLYKDLDSRMYAEKKNDNDYVEFVKFCFDELPNSTKVCWDLVYWMNSMGKIKERDYYLKKCLEINPAHTLAKMNLRIIESEANVPIEKKSKMVFF